MLCRVCIYLSEEERDAPVVLVTEPSEVPACTSPTPPEGLRPSDLCELPTNAAESAEVLLRTLREADFPLEMAAYAMKMVASFVTGFVLAEQSALIEPEKFQEAPDEMIRP